MLAAAARPLWVVRWRRRRRIQKLVEVRQLWGLLEGGLDLGVGAAFVTFCQVHPCDPADILSWTNLVRDLHASGASLCPTLAAMDAYLDSQIALDMDQYYEALPRRSQLVLTVFFAPGAFFILLFPWLRATF